MFWIFYFQFSAKENDKDPKFSMYNLLLFQATAFLLLGFVVMIGSMSLIILDWIHNATAGAEAHGDGH